MKDNIHPRIAFTAAAALALLAGCTSAPSTTSPPASSAGVPANAPTASTARQAVANLGSASASLVSGKLTLVPVAGGVRVTGEVGGLSPGSTHGFHVHEKGDCSAVDASSAGGHFNPFGTPHGQVGTHAHHAGDTNNIVADANGVAKVDTQLRGVTLGGGAVNDITGKAVIVHAAPDDYATQPTGNAGARLACGVIKVTM